MDHTLSSCPMSVARHSPVRMSNFLTHLSPLPTMIRFFDRSRQHERMHLLLGVGTCSCMRSALKIGLSSDPSVKDRAEASGSDSLAAGREQGPVWSMQSEQRKRRHWTHLMRRVRFIVAVLARSHNKHATEPASAIRIIMG
eukprot:764314-Hanusia_phi.AAC.2